MEVSKKYEDLQFLMEALTESKKSKVIHGSPKKVGAVVVKNGRIVGRGCRTTTVLKESPYKDITYHAEHLAIIEAGEKAEGATIYCTLEPCAKRSVLPGSWEPPNPCCQIIAESKIVRVVIPKMDDREGSGGAEYLEEKGVSVCFFETGIEEFEKLISADVWRADIADLDKNKYTINR